MNNYLKQFKEYIDEHNLIAPDDAVLLSLSAGKDSMFMLDLFVEIKKEYNLSLGIFHLDHQMRQDESKEDKNFVEAMAHSLNIPLYSYTYDFKKSDSKKISFEEEARNIRYEYLQNCAKKNNFNKIATAHNKNDSIETILMRIFSGTGLRGLLGISPKRDNIIRPVLSFFADEIYDYLNDQSIPWREDSSNKSLLYERNFIRNELIPLIQSRFPQVSRSIVNLEQISREALFILDDSVIKDESIIIEESTIIIKTDLLNSTIKLKHALASFIPQFFKENAGTRMIEEIIRRVHVSDVSHEMYSFNTGYIYWKNETREIVFVKGNVNSNESDAYLYKIDLSLVKCETIYIPEIKGSISIEKSDFNTFLQMKSDTNYIFVTKKEEWISIILRNRKSDDKIKLKFGTKKIKNIFNEKKLDNEVKNCVPFLVINKKIAALMPGFIDKNIPNRIASEFLVTSPEDIIFVLKFEKNSKR